MCGGVCSRLPGTPWRASVSEEGRGPSTPQKLHFVKFLLRSEIYSPSKKLDGLGKAFSRCVLKLLSSRTRRRFGENSLMWQRAEITELGSFDSTKVTGFAGDVVPLKMTVTYAGMGSFDSAETSLREVPAALRMTI